MVDVQDVNPAVDWKPENQKSPGSFGCRHAKIAVSVLSKVQMLCALRWTKRQGEEGAQTSGTSRWDF